VEQGLPSSVHIEVTVLGACILDAAAFNSTLEYLSPSDFSLDSHQKIFLSISELFETGNVVDHFTVAEDLSARRWLDAVGGHAYLAQLTEGIPKKPNIEAYIKILKDKSLLRQMISVFNTGSVRAADQSESAATILGDIEEQILELSQQQTTKGLTTILDAVKEVGSFDAYVDRMCDPAEMTGLSTGLIDVDKVWGGMKPTNLIIIAARPSMGKSALLFNIAVNVVTADAEMVVAIFSLEMSKEGFFNRIVASTAGVSLRRAEEGFVSAGERTKMASALLFLGNRNIHIDDTATITPIQIRAKARRLKQQFGRLDMIGIDYIQLIKGQGKYGNRQEEVSAVSRSMKALAKELDVPVVALAQLNRQTESRGDKRPMLSDLRETGSLEQDADIVAFIYRDEYYRSEDDPDVERGVAEIITSKNRDGATGTRKVAYQGAITKFSNLHIQRGGSDVDYREETDY
jgi:replicative DNA helicase